MVKNFKYPKREMRPVPFWSWNEKLNKRELSRQMRCMKQAGYGGFFMHSRVGLVTTYLSEEWMQLVKFCAEYSQKIGLQANLYDEDMWPSGYGAGLVPAHSEDFHERALVLLEKGTRLPNDTLVTSIARGGKEYEICIRVCASGNVRFAGQCYIDIFNPEAIQFFFRTIHEKYRKHMGELFGSALKYIFSDEACYGIHWFYSVPHTTYSPYLRSRIQRECGYDILEHAVKLFFDEGDYRKIRVDFFRCASEQFNESYTIPYQKYCAEHGLQFTGHLMAEESMYEQAQWTAGVMPCYEFMDVPGIDKLSRVDNDQLVTVKQMTSVAEQLQKPRALSECFAGIGHENGFTGRKKIIDWQAVHGINYINMHLSHYSMRGERKRDYPPNIFYQQPYFPYEKTFSDYAARLCRIASFGKPQVHILVLSPLQSVLAQYNPNDADNEKVLREKYDTPFASLCSLFETHKIDWHIGDETVLERHARIEGNKFVVGGSEYDVVVLPPLASIKKNTAALLHEFGKVGKIFSCGEFPQFTDGISAEIKCNYETVSPERLIEILAEKYAVLKCGYPNLIARRRVQGNEEVYLLVNRSAQEQIRVDFSAFPRRPDYLLCLSDGNTYRIPQHLQSFIMEPLGSAVFLCGSAAKCQNFSLPDRVADGTTWHEREYSVIEPVSIQILDENALVIDHVRFASGNDPLPPVDEHVQNIWHRRFYPLPEGTPFTAEYRFWVGEIPSSPVFAVIENAENLEEILLNGVPLHPMRKKGELQVTDRKCYKDLAFTRVPLGPFIKPGENVLRIRGEKRNNITEVCCHRSVLNPETHFATEVDAVYIVGDFALDKRSGKYYIAAKKPLRLGNIAEQGYPFYSGRIAYKIHSDAQEIYAKGDAVTLASGKNVSHEPFLLCMDKNGGGTVIAANTLYALFGPQYLKGYDALRWVDPGVFNDIQRYSDDYLIKPFGLTEIRKLR